MYSSSPASYRKLGVDVGALTASLRPKQCSLAVRSCEYVRGGLAYHFMHDVCMHMHGT